MKNLEPIARLYFLLFAGVTGLIILMMLCGCNPAIGISPRNTEIKYGTYIIDGCQYLTVENGTRFANDYSFSMCHKGNCTNQIHGR